MTTRVRCPDCYARVEAPEQPDTRSIVCPRCGVHFTAAPQPRAADRLQSEQWYCQVVGNELGPMPLDDLRCLVNNGHLLSSDLVREGASGPWRTAGEIPSLVPPETEMIGPAPASAQPTASLASPETEAFGAASVPSQPNPLMVAVVAASVAAVFTTAACWFLFSRRGDPLAVAPPVAMNQTPPPVAPAVATDQTPTNDPVAPPVPSNPVASNAPPQPRGDPPPDSTGEAAPDVGETDPGKAPDLDAAEPAPEADAVEPAPADGMHVVGPAKPEAPPGNRPKAADPPARQEPNEVISRPGMPQTVGSKQVPSAGQAKASIEQRLARLKIIYGRRAELLAEHAKLQQEIKAATAEKEAIERDAAAAATLSVLAAGQQGSANEPLLQAQQDAAMAKMTALTIQAQQVAKRLEDLTAKIQPLAEQSDALRIEWLAIVDPFGQTSARDLQREITTFSEWIALDKQNDAAYLGRGFAHWHLGSMKEALADFSSAVKLNGSMLAAALAARGGALCAQEKHKEGMKDIGKALKVNRSESLIYLMRARANCATKKFHLVANDFKLAARTNPEDAETFRNWALFEATCPERKYRSAKGALEHARKACTLTSNNDWAALAALAAAYAESGDLGSATEFGTRAAELAWGEHHDECLEQVELYKAGQPLRLEWREILRPNRIDLPSNACWLDTAEGLRHNNTCKSFRNTKAGRFCAADEGQPCPDCGG